MKVDVDLTTKKPKQLLKKKEKVAKPKKLSKFDLKMLEHKKDEKMDNYCRFGRAKLLVFYQVVKKQISDFIEENLEKINPDDAVFVLDNLKILIKHGAIERLDTRPGNLAINLEWEFQSNRMDYAFLDRLSKCSFMFEATKKTCVFIISERSIYRGYPDAVEAKEKASPDYGQPLYHEQLRMPEWKVVRDRIVESAGYKCERCESEDFLQVHHKKYRKAEGRRLLAWEYNDNELECLCARCHKFEHCGITPKPKDRFDPDYLQWEKMQWHRWD